MQEPIVGVQIYRRDGDVGDDGHVGLLLPDERFDGFGAFEAILSQKMTKGLFHLGLALLGGKVEDAQICTVGTPWGMMGSQAVVGHPEAAGGKQVRTVAIVFKSAGLTHQPVDDVPVLDQVVAFPTQPGQALYTAGAIPDLDVFGVDTHIHRLPDQAAVDRVDVVDHADGAAFPDLDPQALAGL